MVDVLLLYKEAQFKKTMCRIWGDLLAEMEYNIHVFISVEPENKNGCDLVTIE